MKDKVEKGAQWIIGSKPAVIFTGAGLSTESGIPDFRSPGGVWDRYNPEDFYFQNFLSSEASRLKYWAMSTEMYESIRKAQPNLAHLAIAELEKLGRLDCVITQNVDDLHRKAGNTREKIIELHGNATYVTCLNCKKRYDRDDVQKRLQKENRSPLCDACGGLLKSATISFGQAMPVRETEQAYDRSSRCDLFIVIGSSLVVEPAASMPRVAKRSRARLLIVNRDPTPCDALADLVIQGQAGPTMSSILEEVKLHAPKDKASRKLPNSPA